MDSSKANQYSPPPASAPPYAPPPPPSAPPLVTGYPAPQMSQSFHVPIDWSTGLCDCTEDIGNCCMTCWCPCVTFGQIADIVDRGSPACEASGALYALIALLTGCQWIYSFFYRTKLRAQYGLPESPCPDFLVHCCCEPCSLCQSYRELKNRGIDMSIGWHGNMERRGQVSAQIPPTIQGGMMR